MTKKTTKNRPAREIESQIPTVDINPDMAVEDQVPLNELPTFFPNAYEVVVAAARRARQLNLGLKPLVKTGMYRPVDIALAELVAGKVEYEAEKDEPKREKTSGKRKSRSK
ncbi:MAG: DNA-directed RNA polymerase subunit omega [Candidatus Eisenbacteria bacterium]